MSDEPQEVDLERCRDAVSVATVTGVLVKGLVEGDLELHGLVLVVLISDWLNNYDPMDRDERRKFVARMCGDFDDPEEVS